MKERPILFSGEMVRAILDGRKTQTRRVVKFSGHSMFKDLTRQVQEHNEMQCVYAMPRGGFVFWYGDPGKEFSDRAYHNSNDGLRSPFGEPGDRLWVRETWGYPDSNLSPGRDADYVSFRADEQTWWKNCSPPYSGSKVVVTFPPQKWSPSIFMPRWASRITLQITNVRVERVQDITEIDAMHEGLWNGQTATGPDNYHQRKFVELWNKLNVKRGFGWDVNPWVWVIEFQKVGK